MPKKRFIFAKKHLIERIDANTVILMVAILWVTGTYVQAISAETQASEGVASPKVKQVQTKKVGSAGDSSQTQIVRVSGIKPLLPQPTGGNVEPGLSVVYYDKFVRHINAIPKGGGAQGKGRAGKPIPYLNHQFNKGQVFDSGKNRGVCIHMTGLLNFSESGEYGFTALSNDGLRIHIDGETIIDDPAVHSDRFSNSAVVRVDESGWYSIEVLYFQRKGSAALKLFWKNPGSPTFEVVPADAFGHLARMPEGQGRYPRADARGT
jgi:PA14 domain-containing protein